MVVFEAQEISDLTYRLRLRSRRRPATAVNSNSKKSLAVNGTSAAESGKGFLDSTLPTQRGTRSLHAAAVTATGTRRVLGLAIAPRTNRASNFSLCWRLRPNSLDPAETRRMLRVSAGLIPPIWTSSLSSHSAIVHPPYLRSRSTHRKKRWQDSASPRRPLSDSLRLRPHLQLAAAGLKFVSASLGALCVKFFPSCHSKNFPSTPSSSRRPRHRFWPRSRTRQPKQLLNIVGKQRCSSNRRAPFGH